MFARPSAAAKPEDVFKGKIIITKDRLPMRFLSPGAFVSAIQSKKIDKVWPTEEKGADQGTWDLEYIAFFAQPLDDSEIQMNFYDITHGDRKFVAGDAQYTRESGSRILAPASSWPSRNSTSQALHDDHRVQGRVIATTSFWLLGKGPTTAARSSLRLRNARQETRTIRERHVRSRGRGARWKLPRRAVFERGGRFRCDGGGWCCSHRRRTNG